MNRTIGKAVLGLTLIATAVTGSTGASARDRYYSHHRGGNDAAVAVGAGVLGLALGAAIASGDRRGRYYDDRYYYRGGYYAYPRRSYYYYDRFPRRFYRDHYRGRDRFYRDRYDDRRRFRDYRY